MTIKKSDLRKARKYIVSESKQKFPRHKARDTTGPSIEAGLVVAGFEVNAAINYARDLAGRNEHRIANACATGDESIVALFGAAIASGMIIGAQAERMKHGFK